MQIEHRRRLVRSTRELHPRFFQGLIALFVVAPYTADHRVRPAVVAAARLRQYMVDGEIAFFAAILTDEIIAQENVLAREHHAVERHRDVILKLYNERQDIFAVHQFPARLNAFGFVLKQQRDRSFPARDIYRRKCRVKDKDFRELIAAFLVGDHLIHLRAIISKRRGMNKNIFSYYVKIPLIAGIEIRY